MRLFNKAWLGVVAALGMAFSAPATAEDIDLFVGVGGTSTPKSNVLFVIDTGANFSSSAGEGCYINSTTNQVRTTPASGFTKTNLSDKAGGIQQCAIYSVLASLDEKQSGQIQVGIMGFNVGSGQKLWSYHPATDEFKQDCPLGGAGCLLVPLTDISISNNKSRLLNWLAKIETSGNSKYEIKPSNNGQNGAAMQEAWAYFYGKQGISSRDYKTPVAADTDTQCGGKNYIIFTGNAYGDSGKPSDHLDTPETTLKNTSSVLAQRADPKALASDYANAEGTVSTWCGNYTFNTNANGVKSGIYSAHWASYLRRQGVTSYGIGVLAPDKKCKPEYPALLNLLAKKGGGKYFSTTNFSELSTALLTIFDEIMAVNGVFASASLPVSVNTQGTYLNQVFVGMFRPNADKTPRWMGNLKQYKFGFNDTESELMLVDADNKSAIQTNTGFIDSCARSFWGPTSKVDYWTDVLPAVPAGTCTQHPKDMSDLPDGEMVHKGGVGYRLRVGKTPANRNIQTCTGTCSSLAAFANTTDLGKWIRGEDQFDEKPNSNLTEMRPSIHGDVVHSRPVAVDYGDSTGVVVFYGANDGMLRAVNGNQKTKTGNTSSPGDELWAFIAPEQIDRLKRIRDNSPLIDFPSTNTPTTQKPYFFDGPVTAHQKDNKVWVFATQRRGGRMIYAFDASTPTAPTLKWRVGCTDSTDASCATGFTAMGQTWSAPRVMLAKAVGNGATPLLIVGGGYDTCEDTDNGTTTNNTCATPKGNRVYVINANTGVLEKEFTTLRSVPGDVAITRNADGLAQYAYAADTGGSVYRINLTGNASTDWTMTRIAYLGKDTVPASTTDKTKNRKFLNGPTVVVVPKLGFNAVLLGSGDREHPLQSHTATTSIENYFYMLMDKPTDATWLTAENAGTAKCGYDLLCHNSLYGMDATNATAAPKDLGSKKGWRLKLRSQEQVVTASVAVFGEVTFSTHQPEAPSTTSCTNGLGTARVYNLSYLTAAGPKDETKRGDIISGGGLPPSPVAGMVKVTRNGKEETLPFIIGAKSTSPLEVKWKKISGSANRNKERVYWYIQK
jgi:type IV pilus assembly protein PilY1